MLGVMSSVAFLCVIVILIMICIFRKKSTRSPTGRTGSNQYVSTPHITVEASSSTVQHTSPTPQNTSTNYVNIKISNASVQHNQSNRSNKSSELDLSERIYENTNSPFLSVIRNQARADSAEQIPEHDYENTNTIRRNLKGPQYPYADLVFDK